MKIITKYGLTVRGNNQSLNIVFRSVRKYEIVVGHTLNPPQKVVGHLLSNYQKVVGHVPPSPTYAYTPGIAIRMSIACRANLIHVFSLTFTIVCNSKNLGVL